MGRAILYNNNHSSNNSNNNNNIFVRGLFIETLWHDALNGSQHDTF